MVKKKRNKFLYLSLFSFSYLKGHDNNNPISSSNDSYKQRHNSTEFDTFCRQITESAISDYGKKKFYSEKKNRSLMKFYFQFKMYQLIIKKIHRIFKIQNHLQIIQQILNSDQLIIFIKRKKQNIFLMYI
jgi:hypothetical protein